LFHNEFFLGFNVIIPMIIAPDIFSQVKGQSFFPDATFCGKASLQVSPEPFKPVNVAPLAITVLSGMVFYQAMNIAFGSNTGVTLPCIRTDDTSSFYPSRDQG